LRVGSVELHLEAMDWENHNHHLDPAYENTILHVVWAPGRKAFFPATRSFRRVPQVFLRDQLIAPWEQLKSLLPVYPVGERPASKPGLCQKELSQRPPSQVLEILQAAGWFRLQQRAERWRWRRQVVGPTQMLWEALAEGLGYHRNQIPFRLIAQRLPLGELKRVSVQEREALIFGVSGFLPERDLTGLSAPARRKVRELWEIWWKHRENRAHAILPRSQWKLAGVRPFNRPERRLGALALLAGEMGRVERAVISGKAGGWEALLGKLQDSFWDRQTTWRSRPAAQPVQLLGMERIRDLLINVYWPLVWLEKPAEAEKGLALLRVRPNALEEIARQRVLGHLRLGLAGQSALVQQGLLQLYRDFCLTDLSQCSFCSFPGLVQQWDR
jgi:hypothetical protein